MYATKIFGGQGSLSEPVRNTRARYTFGLHTEPNQLTQPWVIVHNGKLTNKEMMQARYTGLIAEGVVPIIVVPNTWDYEGVTGFMRAAETFLSEADRGKKIDDKYYVNIHDYLNLQDERDEKLKNVTGLDTDHPDVRYVLTKVWPKLRPDGMISFKDKRTRYIVCEQAWLARFVNDLQYLVTTQLQIGLRGGFTIKPYGLGMVKIDKSGVTEIKSPSIYTKFFSDNTVKLFLKEDNRTTTDKAYIFMWTYLLARKMAMISGQFKLMKGVSTYKFEDWLNPDQPYVLEDWLAMASEQISYISGYGESSATLKYQAPDLVGPIRDDIGNGIAETYEWQDFPPELQEEILEFWIIRRMAAYNIKALLTPVTIELADHKSDKLRAAYDWTQESVAQLPALGGDTQPYMFMPTNDLGAYFVLPMVLREDPGKPNKYGRQPQRAVPMTTADVRHGEIQGNPLEPMTMKESYIRLNIWNDSRRWDITYPWYKFYVWKFPLEGFKPADWKMNGSSFLTESESLSFQWMMFLLSSMAQGPTTYGEGYFVYDSLGLFGDVPAPFLYGPANPVQQAVSQTPMASKEEASRVVTTPAPGAVSDARTASVTAPPPIGKEMKTPVEATSTASPPTPPVNEVKNQANPVEEKK